MAVPVDAEDVSSLSEVLYKSLRSTSRSIIRWLLKCSNVSPPPTRASDLVKVLEQANLTDVVVHPTDHTPFYVSISIFVLVSFVLFYVLLVAYSWFSSMWASLRTTKEPNDPSTLPEMQPDQIGFEERPPKFKVKMTQPVHVHLVESTKKRSEAASKPKGGSIRENSARGKVESIVEVPIQTTPHTKLPPGSVEKMLDRDTITLAPTQSSQSLKSSTASGKTVEIPASTTTESSASGGVAPKREAAGRGGDGDGAYDCESDRSSSNHSIYLEELARSPTAAEQKALSLIFGDSDEEESEKTSVLRRRKPQLKDFLRTPPLAKSTPRPSRQTTEVSFREQSEYELSLGARYGAGAETATPPATTGASLSSKKYTPCSKMSSLTATTASDAVAGASPENLQHPTIGLLPLVAECAVRAGCRECQLQPLHVVVLRWSDANSKTVFITGSFVNWNSKIPMHRDRVGWVVELRLPRGHHEYRFIVDGKWQLDRGRLGTIHSAQQKGITNHIVHVN
ncbi:hypothetical protein PMAYCL1PPCAC_21024 [Pristionchus mayeri]|uniref:5'-AMP-activated protein kinase subunit beta-1 n=1 Tax=Pristionchus mayeri TaxID=1317129 RepID=A0AAN5CV90_9BILA|nr:hypothetical protein PMAYCL1PPCAC_21024 [Pristionchus mayeri]